MNALNWRKILADEKDPDDELLSETPPDVIAVLGFDPAEEADQQAREGYSRSFKEAEGYSRSGSKPSENISLRGQTDLFGVEGSPGQEEATEEEEQRYHEYVASMAEVGLSPRPKAQWLATFRQQQDRLKAQESGQVVSERTSRAVGLADQFAEHFKARGFGGQTS